MSESLPLHGVSVLDLSDEATVLASRLLADLGADVVRAEAMTGDRLRRRGPFVDAQPGLERSLPHLLYNAGKRSVALAMDVPESWELLDRMTDAVDIVIAPLEKSGLARAFFEEERLTVVHPGIGVVDAVFRRDSPAQAVTDLIAVAAGGLLYCNGFPDRAPDWPAGNLAYKQLSLVACAAAMSLVMSRKLGGKGGRIVVGLQEAVMSTTIQAANQNLWRWQGAICRRAGMGGLEYPVLGQGRVALVRTSGTTYQCKDGRWVSFGIWPPRWHDFVGWVSEATGSEELASEAWGDPLYRVQHRDEVDAAICNVCAALPRDELVKRGQELGLLVLPVNTVVDIASDPHLAARGFFRDVWHPALGQSLRLMHSPLRSSNYETELRPAPVLGEHSLMVLRDLVGLNETEVKRLLATGLIAATAGSEATWKS